MLNNCWISYRSCMRIRPRKLHLIRLSGSWALSKRRISPFLLRNVLTSPIIMIQAASIRLKENSPKPIKKQDVKLATITATPRPLKNKANLNRSNQVTIAT